MSVNQISNEYLWWTPHHLQPHSDSNCSPNPKSLAFNHHLHNFHNLNPAEEDESTTNRAQMSQNHTMMMMEVMFEKPLTPSDVGKLNRLVIPKQHAERHFPLNAAGGDSPSPSGGMLLSFEDESGKFWRFRYSYWNSSQSYVLTKGWSRYVKEKRLDAGDVVLFQRHPSDPDRLFIACRRRTDPVPSPATTTAAVNSPSSNSRPSSSFYPAHQVQTYLAHQQYRPDPESSAAAAAAAGAGGAVVVDNRRTASSGGGSMTLRLFGVNMEYHQVESDQSEPATPDGSSTSSHSHYQQHHYATTYPYVSYGMTNHIMQQDGGQHLG